MMGIVGSSVVSSTVLYLLVSVFGAATYGTNVQKVILNSFPKESIPFILARFMYIFLLVLSFPLQVFPSRLCIEKMATSLKPTMSVTFSRSLYLVSTFGIIATCAGVGALIKDVNKALSWVGATAGTFICYFLPAVIYNKLYMGTRMDWRRISAIVLFLAGCFTIVLAITGLVRS